MSWLRELLLGATPFGGVMAFGAALALGLPLASCASPSPQDKSSQMTRSDDGYESEGRRVPSTKTLYSMARILANQEKDAECEAVLSRLIADHPDFRPAYADLGALYVKHDRVDSAIEALKAGVAAAPDDAVLHNNLGLCYLMQGRNDEALESFTAAATGTPRDMRSRANMAVALGMMGRLDEALSVYLQVMPPAEAHYNLGVLCEARNDTERAAKEFEIAETLRSGKPKALPTPAPAPATKL